MRLWACLIACAGCGFELRAPAVTDAPSGDSADAPPDGPLPACMTNPAYTAGGPEAGHRYRATTTTMVYDSAVEHCATDGAHLVAIGSAEENAYVDTLLGANEAWIGFDDLEREGTFRWVNGAPDGYRNFTGTQPNDNGTEDCTTFAADGTWIDDPCEGGHRAVCECDPGYVAPTVATCRAIAGSTAMNGRLYFTRVLPKSWPDAVADCRAIGAFLAVPGDDDENAKLDGSHPMDSWIGYADQAVPGTFAWVNGAPVSYTRWGTAQPTNLPNGGCVAIALAAPQSASWDDADCGILRRYSCECDPLAH